MSNNPYDRSGTAFRLERYRPRITEADFNQWLMTVKIWKNAFAIRLTGARRYRAYQALHAATLRYTAPTSLATLPLMFTEGLLPTDPCGRSQLRAACPTRAVV